MFSVVDAWKTPVVFLENQRVYDLTEILESSPRPKRQKNMIKQFPECIDLAADDSDDNDVLITYYGQSNDTNSNAPRVKFSGFTTKEEAELKNVFFNLIILFISLIILKLMFDFRL